MSIVIVHWLVDIFHMILSLQHRKKGTVANGHTKGTKKGPTPSADSGRVAELEKEVCIVWISPSCQKTVVK